MRQERPLRDGILIPFHDNISVCGKINYPSDVRQGRYKLILIPFRQQLHLHSTAFSNLCVGTANA
jgi:hypothetical protein